MLREFGPGRGPGLHAKSRGSSFTGGGRGAVPTLAMPEGAG